VGSLIANDLVLTSAHLIYMAKGYSRLKAFKIEVYYGNQIIEANYCSDFPKYSYAREHDFALLRLREKIYLNSYLFIAKDYEAMNNISLLSINENSKRPKIVRIITDKTQVTIDN
jgi:hypothetical protein